MKIRTAYFAIVIDSNKFSICPDHVRQLKESTIPVGVMVRSTMKIACDLCHAEAWKEGK